MKYTLDALSIITAIAIITLLTSTSAAAGELSLYGKTGYFSLTETIDGHRYVRESGFIYGIGATYSMGFAKYFTAKGTVEGFYGKPDYQGIKIPELTEIKSDTTYLGTKEEVALAARTVFGRFVVGPTLGFGHKWFDRSRSDELWSYFYVKGGAVAECNFESFKVITEAGVMNQLDTTINVDWSGLGYGKFTSKPKGKINPYAEIRVVGKKWFAALFFEQANWGKSDGTSIQKQSTTVNGVVLINGLVSQPDTKSSIIGLSAGYNF